jgi:integrase/recombinase XerC
MEQISQLVPVEIIESSPIARVGSYFAEALESELDILSELLNSKNSEGTRREYRKDLTDFFLRMTGSKPKQEGISEFLRLDAHKATIVVTKYRTQLNELGLSPNTINRRLAAIKSLIAFGRKMGICTYTIDVDNVTVQPYRDTSGVTEEEFIKVMKGCDLSTLIGKRNYALLLLLWGNALRRNEISTLDVGNFDASKGTLSILGKGKQKRVVIHLPKNTTLALIDWLIARRADMSSNFPLFTSVDFHHFGHRLTGDGIYKIVRGLFQNAGVDKQMSPHRCRHSAITALLEKTDGNVRKAQKLSRHAKLNTLQIYDDNRNCDQLEMSELLMDGL